MSITTAFQTLSNVKFHDFAESKDVASTRAEEGGLAAVMISLQ
jgi:hypothetical protein